MKIGTRSSAMAMAQTQAAASMLERAHGNLTVEIEKFVPFGDQDQTSKLLVHGGKGGAFVQEIRDAVRAGSLQAAMHSLKDMPGDEEAPGLVIGAVLAREAVEDVIVLRGDRTLDELTAGKGDGFKIGTNSVRRQALLKTRYPHADIIHFRGAVDTRIRKLDEKIPQKLPDGGTTDPADAIIVARAGLERLGLADRISHIFDAEDFLPAIGQGVVALECARDDFDTLAALKRIEDPATRLCVEAEREMLWILNGHCNAPIAGLATIANDQISLKGAVFSADGETIIETHVSGAADMPRDIGRKAGLDLIKKGADALIDAARL